MNFVIAWITSPSFEGISAGKVHKLPPGLRLCECACKDALMRLCKIA